MSSNIKARRPSEMQSFVTPTPKKARITGDKSYNRKKKSLGLLAQSFLERFSNSPSGEEVYIDRLAQELAVERRRIYDVVNILESLRIVIKRGKNSYTWMGTTHLPRMFALVQHDAIFEYPQDALDNGIIDQKPSDQEIHAAQTNRNMSESKSLSRLSQLFLRIFLVGHQTLSLPEASDKINKEVTSMDDLAAIGCKDRCPIPDDPVLYKQAAMRGLKTKIRRMYDISNCFASIGLIKKVDERCMPMESRRPRFRWCYKMSAQDISKVYKDLPEQMKRKRTPFLEGVETMTTTMPTPSSWLPGLAPSPNAVSLAAASAHQTPMPPPLSQTSTSSCDTTSTKSVSESSNEENALLSMINQTGGAVSATKEDHRRQPAANKDSLAQLAARGLPVY